MVIFKSVATAVSNFRVSGSDQPFRTHSTMVNVTFAVLSISDKGHFYVQTAR
jgi:hypothetical protein